jgi:hypothetical protein
VTLRLYDVCVPERCPHKQKAALTSPAAQNEDLDDERMPLDPDWDDAPDELGKRAIRSSGKRRPAVC